MATKILTVVGLVGFAAIIFSTSACASNIPSTRSDRQSAMDRRISK